MRPFEPEDAEAVFAVFADPEVGRWVGGAHTTIDRSRDLIDLNRRHVERHGFGMWAVEREGELIGEAGVQLLERAGPEIEIGWTIGRPWWGRGYATEAARAWLDVARTVLGFDEVIATVLPGNAASRRVAQKVGMHFAGHRHVHGGEHEIWAIRLAAGGAAPRAGASSASRRSAPAAARRPTR